MSKKRMSLSDVLNAQLGDTAGAGFEQDAEDMFDTTLDAYDSNDDTLEAMMPPAKAQRTEVEGKKKAVPASGKKQKSLRARGPLDEGLSTGQYDAVPITIGDAEAAVDDIFGMLDEDEHDLAHEQAIDDEDEYQKWLESTVKAKRKAGKRRAATHGTGDAFASQAAATAEDADVLAQLNALRERQLTLVGSATDEEPQGESTRAADSMRAMLDAYAAMLRVRVKLQPVVAKLVQMPQYYALPHFTHDNDLIAQRCDAIRASIRNVYEDFIGMAQGCTEIDNNPFAASSSAGKKAAAAGASITSYDRLAKFHAAVVSTADAVITHWAARVVQPNAAKLKVVNQPLVDQIKSIFAAKVRLLGKVQKNRSHARIFGHPEHVGASSAADRAAAIAAGDFDEEIFDDGDFVRELVHRSGAASQKLQAALQEQQQQASLSRSGSGDSAALRGLSKVGFHRKTKGKSVNYDPRPKLVGFMVRLPYEQAEEQREAILSSLFK